MGVEASYVASDIKPPRTFSKRVSAYFGTK